MRRAVPSAPARPAKPALRRDAQRNRDRIIAATRAAFQERGLEVGVDEIARRAGVGMGTLYRHFPTKDALIDAIVDARFSELTEAAERALAAEDAWEGFEAFLVAAVDLQASDRGFKDALAARGRDERRVKAARRKIHTPVQALVDRRAPRPPPDDPLDALVPAPGGGGRRAACLPRPVRRIVVRQQPDRGPREL